jgi:hypothetical protein
MTALHALVMYVLTVTVLCCALYVLVLLLLLQFSMNVLCSTAKLTRQDSYVEVARYMSLT